MGIRTHNSAYQLEASILKEIQRSFAAEHRDYVTTKLASTGLPMGAVAPPPRVHAAILFLAKGDVARFDDALAQACGDWRDTLSAAGLANQNWKVVLQKRGIDCSAWPAGPASPAG
jgi:crotonobetainyl-CoA:carnitine CoA-transferase CaiB-like acyl-CoA transferase